jgi:hypothetical protein
LVLLAVLAAAAAAWIYLRYAAPDSASATPTAEVLQASVRVAESALLETSS